MKTVEILLGVAALGTVGYFATRTEKKGPKRVMLDQGESGACTWKLYRYGSAFEFVLVSETDGTRLTFESTFDDESTARATLKTVLSDWEAEGRC